MISKKLAAFALAAACVLGGAALGGCTVKGDDENGDSEIYGVYKEYVAYAEANGDTALTYEQWLESIKGEKGDKGDTGEKGEKGDKGDKGDDGSKYIVSAKQLFADRWEIAYYFEFTFSDGSKITTESTAIVTVDTEKVYVAESEEEREILRGYGVAEDKIKYEPVYDPVEYAFAAPLDNIDKIVTESGETYYDIARKVYKLHGGIDFAANAGDEVYASRDGVIEEIKTMKTTYGTGAVKIKHADGLYSEYDCMDVREGLAVGDEVKCGDVIGTVASNTVTNQVTVGRFPGTVESLVAGDDGVTVVTVVYTYTDGQITNTYKVTELDKSLAVGDEVAVGDILGTYTCKISGYTEGDFDTHLCFAIIANEKDLTYAFLGLEEPPAE